MPTLFVETYRELAPHDQQEWVLTNGLGGFASSTAVGMNTRRYHALLCAATLPPVGRVVTVNRIAETLTVDGDDAAAVELSINTFRDAIHPRGDRYLTDFSLGDEARWTYDANGVTVVKQLLILRGRNATAVRYTVDAGTRPFKLALVPFASLRDFHSLRHADGSNMQTEASARHVTLRDGANHVTITADAGRFDEQPNWWYGHVYPVETERGQDDAEDLFTPGTFTLEGTGQASVTLWIATEPMAAGDYDAELQKRHDAATPAPATARGDVRCLVRAADDFVVARQTRDGRAGTTVIAGYPWFADWGRDTMISLPGLLLCTGRFDEAKAVLSVFAQYVDGGMIPNRFDDYTDQPEYNTVDASLWFIHAAFEYQRLSRDAATFDAVLRPACRKIIDGYKEGTRYHIKMDPADSLISQGDAHTQLTWMDALYNGTAFTPRQGKPVEINALWYHALVLMGLTDLAAKVSTSFRQAFWLGLDKGLADVFDDGRADESIRPNQIFAVSLPNSPLSREQQAAVVEIVQRELLTPVGLRTLNRGHPNYHGRYTGDQAHRDAAYHNGTVWPWLLGPFLDAYLNVHERTEAAKAQARGWLQPIMVHLSDEGAIGQVSEIFDGDAPHRPLGCNAQAWSVAEVLRLAMELGM